MIDTVIFDIGNVLVHYDWQTPLRARGFSEKENEAIANAAFLGPDWKELDRGVLTTEEILARMCSHAPQYAADIRRSVLSLKDTVRQCDFTKPWLCELKKQGLKTYYLSNYGPFAYRETKDELDFLSLMDGGLFSYEVQIIKPSRWIYEALLFRYGIDRTRAVFFDDTRANVEAAKKAGLAAFVFTGREEADKEIKRLRLA